MNVPNSKSLELTHYDCVGAANFTILWFQVVVYKKPLQGWATSGASWNALVRPLCAKSGSFSGIRLFRRENIDQVMDLYIRRPSFEKIFCWERSDHCVLLSTFRCRAPCRSRLGHIHLLPYPVKCTQPTDLVSPYTLLASCIILLTTHDQAAQFFQTW